MANVYFTVHKCTHILTGRHVIGKVLQQVTYHKYMLHTSDFMTLVNHNLQCQEAISLKF